MKLFNVTLAGAAMAVIAAAGAGSCAAQSAQGSAAPPKPSATQTAVATSASGAASAGTSSATAVLPAGVLSMGEYSVPKPDDAGKTTLVPFDSWKITAGANGGYALEATVITQATTLTSLTSELSTDEATLSTLSSTVSMQASTIAVMSSELSTDAATIASMATQVSALTISTQNLLNFVFTLFNPDGGALAFSEGGFITPPSTTMGE